MHAGLVTLALFLSGCSSRMNSTADQSSCMQSYTLTAQQQQSSPDISQLSPELQSQWDHEQNAHLGNIIIRPQSNRKVHWICTQCPDGHPHMWQAVVQNRTNNRGCPFCSGRYVCLHNSLPRIAPLVANEWDTAKNPNTPHDYTAGSHRPAHWVCTNCGHEWQAMIRQRALKGTGCPVCTLTQRRRQPTVTSTSSSMKRYWDSLRNAEQGLDPDVIRIGSQQKANFFCDKCPQKQAHRWTTTVQSVFKGSGCPCCSGQKVCKCNSLQTLRPDLAAEWCHALNEGTPEDYTARSRVVVWWQNDKRGQWKETINCRFYRVTTQGQCNAFPLLPCLSS